MPTPSLEPTSATSTVKLPASGTHSRVLSSLALGIYNSTAFVSGAVDQVKYTYYALGGNILDIEIEEENVYNNYERSCLRYSYILNGYQARNVLADMMGQSTGSFDQDGQLTSGSAGSGSHIETLFPRTTFGYMQRYGEGFSSMANVGGTTPIYSASFTAVNGQQDYDLQAIISASSANVANAAFPFYDLVKDKRVLIRRVFYQTPYANWRWFGAGGYWGALGSFGNLHSYGQFADDTSYEVVPVYQNKLQAMAYKDTLRVRTSHFSYEIKDNRVRIFPIPSSASPNHFWVEFSIVDDAWSDPSGRDKAVSGINSINNIPFENIPYETINSFGKAWIREYALWLCVETLGLHVRGKFSGRLPYINGEMTLNADALFSAAEKGKEALEKELKETLEKTSYQALAEAEGAKAENAHKALSKAPMPFMWG